MSHPGRCFSGSRPAGVRRFALPGTNPWRKKPASCESAGLSGKAPRCEDTGQLSDPLNPPLTCFRPLAPRAVDEAPRRPALHLAEVRRALPFVRGEAGSGRAGALVTIDEKGLVRRLHRRSESLDASGAGSCGRWVAERRGSPALDGGGSGEAAGRRRANALAATVQVCATVRRSGSGEIAGRVHRGGLRVVRASRRRDAGRRAERLDTGARKAL